MTERDILWSRHDKKASQGTECSTVATAETIIVILELISRCYKR